MKAEEAAKLIVKAGRELSETGLIARTWGNVSCRIDSDNFMITPSGRDYLSLREEEIVSINIETLEHEGEIKPSSEKKVHREIYRLKSEANFIIHTHQHNASAISAMGVDRIKLSKTYPLLGDVVFIAPYSLPGTKKITEGIAKTISGIDSKAVIMSNHGAVCYGKDYEEAFAVAKELEEACGDYLEELGVPASKGDEEHFRDLWNSDPAIMKYMEIRAGLPAYIDDFAQIIGPKLPVICGDEKKVEAAIKKAQEKGRPLLVKGIGAMCNGDSADDCTAISMIIEKNCRAALTGLGVKPIKKLESMLMRQVYLRKYSKLKAEPKSK